MNENMRIENLSDQNISIVPEKRKSIDMKSDTPGFNNSCPTKAKPKKHESEAKVISHFDSMLKNLSIKARAKMVGINSGGASSGPYSIDGGSTKSFTRQHQI